MKKLIVYLLCAFLFASCGRSAKEQEQLKQDSLMRAKFHNDSLQKVQKINDSIQFHDQLQSQIRSLQKQLEDINSQIIVAGDKLEQMQHFKIGRSKAKREEQLQNQSRFVFMLRDSSTNIRKQIQALQQQWLH